MSSQIIDVAAACAAGACEEFLRWAGPRSTVSVAEVLSHCPAWAAWAESRKLCRLTQKQVGRVATCNSWAAAEHLTDRLTDAHISRIVESAPPAAARYLASRLTPMQIWLVVEIAPWAAAEYLADRLTAEQRSRLEHLARRQARTLPTSGPEPQKGGKT